MRSVRALVAALLFFHAVIAFGQSTGTITGIVTSSTNTPAPSVVVELVDLHRTTTADANGKYTFNNVPSGHHLLQANSPRFGTGTTDVLVNGATTMNLALDLSVHHEEIVVSGSIDPRAASEVAQPISSLNGQELQSRQQPTLGETLAQEPGVASTGFVPGASRPVIRGFGGDRIRVLEDGVGVGDASNVSQDHNVTVDPANAESIEIVRGPATLLYGSNAVGGVVNIIDDRVPMTRITQALSGAAELRTTSNAGEKGGHLSLTGGSGAFAWQGNFSKRTTGDYETPIGKLFNSDIDTTSGSLGASFVGDHGFLGISYGGLDTNYGVSDAGPGVKPEETVRIDMRQRRWDLKGETAFDSGPLSRIRVRIGNTDYRHFEIAGGTPAIEFLNRSTEGRVEASHRDLGPLHGAFGVQYSTRDFKVEGEESLLPPTVTKSRSAFIFEEAGRGAWRLQFGGRYEHQDVTVTSDELPDRSFNGLSGSAGVVYVPNADYTASLSMSHSSRLPVAEELYFDGAHEATFQFEVGNPNLRKESGNGLDLSLRKRTGVVTGELSFFQQRFDGYIFQQATGAEEDGFRVFEFQQRNANFRGAEAHVDFALLHSDPNHLALEFTGDYVRATLANGGGSLPFIPPVRYGVGLRYQGAAIFALAEVRRANAQNHVADFETTTPGYTLVNAALGYRLFTGKVVHDLMLRGNNLTDELAYNHVNPIKDAVPMPGRDFTLSYRLTF
ncbi:MAG: iron complex outerrane recepter protein [Acidobacteriota bacterium]|jgi:iron complex outermembrane receptor protein|nr:iron complex outerrane recepter protein [Acidobacteriota bacterium]